MYKYFLADPGEARGCSTISVVSDLVAHTLFPAYLRRQQAQTIKHIKTIRRIDYVAQVQDVQNHKVFQNQISAVV